MNPQHHTEIELNQHDQWLINHIVTLSNINDQYFKSLSKHRMNQHLENFYQ
jgi:epoxyqueuosine reductase QueG